MATDSGKGIPEINKSSSSSSNDDNISTNADMILCNVCNLPTSKRIRCNAYVCEACKKFFLRNRNKLPSSLRCTGGYFNCTTDAHRASLQTNSSGISLRFLCPYCRFAKCVSVGMRAVKDLANKDKSKPTGDSEQPEKCQKSPVESFMPNQQDSSSKQRNPTNDSTQQAIKPSEEEHRLLLEILHFRDHPAITNHAELLIEIERQLLAIHHSARVEPEAVEERVTLLTNIVVQIRHISASSSQNS